MDDAFAIILVVVVAAGVVAGVWAAARDRDAYGDVGGGPLAMDRGPGTTGASGAGASGGVPSGALAAAEREAEIRQLLEARNLRRVARGQEPFDVDDELARLLAAPPTTATDPALQAEIRELVVARNARRARAGKPPLDVDAEVARQLRDPT
jgi:hypothetical protein